MGLGDPSDKPLPMSHCPGASESREIADSRGAVGARGARDGAKWCERVRRRRPWSVVLFASSPWSEDLPVLLSHGRGAGFDPRSAHWNLQLGYAFSVTRCHSESRGMTHNRAPNAHQTRTGLLTRVKTANVRSMAFVKTNGHGRQVNFVDRTSMAKPGTGEPAGRAPR